MFCHAGPSSLAFLAGCLKILTDVIRSQRIDCSLNWSYINHGYLRCVSVLIALKAMIWKLQLVSLRIIMRLWARGTRRWFQFPEIHCICSVIGELESFRNDKGFSVIFPKILAAIKHTRTARKVRIFLIPISFAFLHPKILGFLFSTKNSLTLGVKCEKSNFKKS